MALAERLQTARYVNRILYFLLRAALAILAKLQFANNLTCYLSLYFKNEYTQLVYLCVFGDLL